MWGGIEWRGEWWQKPKLSSFNEGPGIRALFKGTADRKKIRISFTHEKY